MFISDDCNKIITTKSSEQLITFQLIMDAYHIFFQYSVTILCAEALGDLAEIFNIDKEGSIAGFCTSSAKRTKEACNADRIGRSGRGVRERCDIHQFCQLCLATEHIDDLCEQMDVFNSFIIPLLSIARESA